MTRQEMMSMLDNYNRDMLEIDSINLSLLPKSPSLSEEQGGVMKTKEQRYNDAIDRKEELIKKTSYLSRCVDMLRDVNDDYYRIVYHHWIIVNPKSLTYIAQEMFGYDDYSSFWRTGLKQRALDELLLILQSHAM